MGDDRLGSWLKQTQWLESGSTPSFSSPSKIFRVPRKIIMDDPMLSMVYKPKVISLGPFHFLTPDLEESETLKCKVIAKEAVRTRLPPNFFIPLGEIRQAGQGLEEIRQVGQRLEEIGQAGQRLEELRQRPGEIGQAGQRLEEIRQRLGEIGQAGQHLEEIRQILQPLGDNFFSKMVEARERAYGNEPTVTRLNNEVFVIMMFRDVYFLLIIFFGILPIMGDMDSSIIVYQTVGSGLLREILTDAIKLENQIPLSALQALYPSLSEANIEFGNFLISMCRLCSPFFPTEREALENLRLFTKDHLLHCLYEMSVSAHPKPFPEKSWCQRWPPFAWMRTHCLGWFKKDEIMFDFSLQERVVASAVELSKAGVKFRPFVGGIKHLRFDEDTCTLYLPRLKITGDYTMVVLKNMVALEWGLSPDHGARPVTCFLGLLDELIVTQKDVELFQINKIFEIRTAHDIQVVGWFKNLTISTWRMYYYTPIDRAKRKMNKIYKSRKWRILWSEFVEAYWSKPWVFLSAVAGAALLLMTMAQVVCLFAPCSRKA